MSRGTKSKAVSGEKGSPSQDESESGDMKIADLLRMMNERFGGQKRFKENMNSRFEAFQEDIKNTDQRFKELQLRVPRPRLADKGIQEGKPDGRKDIATEARGRRITPPEPQR